MEKCAICDTTIESVIQAINTVIINGQEYFFCSIGCKLRFLEGQEKYLKEEKISG